jgi:hypothetical protein
MGSGRPGAMARADMPWRLQRQTAWLPGVTAANARVSAVEKEFRDVSNSFNELQTRDGFAPSEDP